jgi:hypothetical protein
MPDDGIRRIWIGKQANESTLTTMAKMILCTNFKGKTPTQRVTPVEYGDGLTSEYSTITTTRSGEIEVSAYVRHQYLPWLLLGCLGAPTSTLVASSGGDEDVQTVAFTGTWANGDTYTLTIDGFTTGNITYNTTAATHRTNIITAVAALPNVVTAADTGTVNIVVGLPSGTPHTYTLTCADEFINRKMFKYTATIVAQAAGDGAITVTHTTPGEGAYDHVFTGGGASKPFVTIVEYDGVDYTIYKGFAADEWKFEWGQSDAMKFTMKGVCADAPTHASSLPSYCAPVLVRHAYVEPVDPTQIAVSHLGGSYTLMKSGSLMGKNNRAPIHALTGTDIDAVRVGEGRMSGSFDFKARYTAYTGSALEKYETSADPTSLILTCTSTTTIGDAGAQNPTTTIQALNPAFDDGERNPFATPYETEIDMKGKLLHDPTDTTYVRITVRNEEPYIRTPT